MTTIYINKMKAAETGLIEIRFAYEKTVLHYLKRFFKKNATWNADEKVWLVSASNEISMELFLKAIREWCEISITEPKAEEIEEDAAGIEYISDGGDTYSEFSDGFAPVREKYFSEKTAIGFTEKAAREFAEYYERVTGRTLTAENITAWFNGIDCFAPDGGASVEIGAYLTSDGSPKLYTFDALDFVYED